MRFFVCLILTLSIFAGALAQGKKSRTSSSVKKEKTELSRQIGKTKEDIEANRKRTRNQLNQLNSLNSSIEQTLANINDINRNISQLAKQEQKLTDSINAAEARIAVLNSECANSLRDSRKRRRNLTEMNLVFSSSTFRQALKRIGYIHQLNSLMTDRADELRALKVSLAQKREELSNIKTQQQQLLASLETENATLRAQRDETQSLVNDLRHEGQTLQAILQDQQEKARRLDAELERIIAEEARKVEEERLAQERRQAEERRKEEKRLAEEQRKKEEQQKLAEQQKKEDKGSGSTTTQPKPKDKDLAVNQPKPSTAKSSDAPSTKPSTTTKPKESTSANIPKLTGTFSANKGQMIFPVAGKHKIISTFGINKHADLPYVQTENSGIDIEANSGANAQAVFDGVVSSIFFLDGFNNVVMVRHGEYLTVYANITNPTVKKGDSVKAGQQLGTIYSDPSDNNRTILHFEVRKEKQKLNPLDWVKK